MVIPIECPLPCRRAGGQQLTGPAFIPSIPFILAKKPLSQDEGDTGDSKHEVVFEAEVLSWLVALNKERAAEEARGPVRRLRPEYQAPEPV